MNVAIEPDSRARDHLQDASSAWLRALELTAAVDRGAVPTLPELVDTLAEKFADAPALSDEQESLDFRALAQRMNRYARWARSEGLGQGDTVCLFVPNCANYIALWLGLLRAGAAVALVNTSLSHAALAHAIRAANPSLVIVGKTLAPRVEAIRALIPSFPVLAHGGAIDEPPGAGLFKDTPLSPRDCPLPQLKSRALLVYTSGTTGLPKAAHISHLKLMRWSRWFAGMLDIRPQDRLYNCLPLYHSVGGVAAVGAMLASGGSLVVRRKFSASRFWEDVCVSDSTLFCYVGELCRYLANGARHPAERRHVLRACFGNGLRADVWKQFQTRFRIPRIVEFYASTEGSFSLFNAEGEVGSIGRIPPFLSQRNDVALIKVDVERAAPLLGPDGRCIACGPGEVGEAIGRLRDAQTGPGSAFEGYVDVRDSERKILRGVFREGDAWFRSGDLMRKDSRGFYFFVDRLGDTFRWKGENVSTQEVEAAIASCPGVVETIVYGVRVPGAEGRAGMAAIVPRPELDLDTLSRHLSERLPAPACPLFIRICRAIETTATFKPLKQQLAREGYDSGLIGDPVYVYNRRARRFVPLTSPVREQLSRDELVL